MAAKRVKPPQRELTVVLDTSLSPWLPGRQQR